jgi:uncharacterized protein YjiS (DUF1127 family)
MARHISTTAWPDEGRSAFRAACRLLHAWRRGWQARRTICTLHGQSDAQLKDIGLRRSEVDGLYVR